MTPRASLSRSRRPASSPLPPFLRLATWGMLLCPSLPGWTLGPVWVCPLPLFSSRRQLDLD
eukprot:6173861-Prorocentrum_lima.AAC.1